MKRQKLGAGFQLFIPWAYPGRKGGLFVPINLTCSDWCLTASQDTSKTGMNKGALQ